MFVYTDKPIERGAEMNTEKKQRVMFIAFAFIWSFVFWVLSIILATKGNVELLQNADLLKAILKGTLGSELRTITILSTLAGYGPAVATIFIIIVCPKTRNYFKNKFKLNTSFKYSLQILGLFIVISTVPAIPLAMANGLRGTTGWPISGLVLLFFIYQFITSGTEELGWRGYLLPSILKEKTPWESSIHIGVVWALWHTPIVLYIFYVQGLPIPQIILSFIGFIAGTIAMSAVHTYYYLKTKNILFSMFIHAVSNTVPMLVGVMVANSYKVSVAVQASLWVFVIVISKKNKQLFDNIYTDL